MADISDFVTVNASIISGGLLRRDFGLTLFVTTDDTLPTGDPIRIYKDLNSVKADFAEGSEPFDAAEIYFEQSPFPKNLLIGRWVDTAVPAELISGVNDFDILPTLAGISDGSLQINAVDVTGIDFSSVLSYNDVATILQTEISAAVTPVTVTFDATTTTLKIETVATGITATLTYATTAASGTDVSNLLKFDTATASTLSQGANAQTIEEAMDNFLAIDPAFYFITGGASLRDTTAQIDLAQWVIDQAPQNTFIYYAESTDPQTLVTDDATSNFALLFAQASSRVSGDYTSLVPQVSSLSGPYLSASSAARLSSVDFGAEDSVINAAFKDRPGMSPITLTDSQAFELDRKLTNRYVSVGGGTASPTINNIYVLGYTFAENIKVTTQYGLDWFVNAIQIDVFDLLKQEDIVTQTIIGQAKIKATIENVCRQAITNGFLAPGIASDIAIAQIKQITGNSKFNGTLSKGYLVYAQQLSTLSETDRLNDKLPPF